MRQFFISLFLLLSLCAVAQTTTRPLRSKHSTKKALQKPATIDSITADSASFRLFGYDKTLRASTESFFATNLTGDTVIQLSGTIEYLTLGKVQLHRRNFSYPITIPPGQTRHITLPAWDKQKVWYYYLSPRPRMATQATPYDIRISVNSYRKD